MTYSEKTTLAQKELIMPSYHAVTYEGRSFSEKVAARRPQLWNSLGDSDHSAHVCEHQLRFRNDNFSTWHCCDLWQSKLSNKLNAKQFAAKCGIATAELFWSGSHPEQIPFSTLPYSYVLKLNNGSGSKQVLPISGMMNLATGCSTSSDEIIAALHKMLIGVNDPDNVILIEALLGNSTVELPNDYKFFCFHGRVQLCYLRLRIRNEDFLTWFDRDWMPLEDVVHTQRPRGHIIQPPPNLSELISSAELLARAYEFPFVRVDLYNPCLVPTFGEFTHTPYGSDLKGYTDFANEVMGILWDNPHLDYSERSKSIIRKDRSDGI